MRTSRANGAKRQLHFARLEIDDIPWDKLDQFADRTVYQTAGWLRFLSETQGATAVVAEITAGNAPQGFLTGLTFTRYGVPLFGSPFPGWTTMAMGFNLYPRVPRWQALEQSRRWLHKELGCAHFELTDLLLTAEDGARAGVPHRDLPTYVTDLTKSEEALFGDMTSACRRAIRKSVKSGVTIEECGGDGDFAIDYYEQLSVVFAKQRLVPTYDVERVRALIRNLLPTGNLLLLRARDPEGLSVATHISVGMNGRAQFWGGASYNFGLPLRPNQALQWHALRSWRERGFSLYDWGGGGSYKEQYGGTPSSIAGFYSSCFPGLGLLRSGAQVATKQRQRLQGFRARGGSSR